MQGLLLMTLLSYPQGWLLENVDGRVRAYAMDRSEYVAVEPLVVNGNDAAGALQRLVAGGQVLWMRNPRLIAMRASGKDMEAQVQGTGPQGAARAHLLLAMRGGVGTLYTAAAPEARFRQRLPELVKTLQSFRAGAEKGSALRYERHMEPREQAFTVEFPAGWRSELIVHREGAMAPRTEASAVAADGGATVFIGERNAGTFVTPSPDMAQFGIREGMVYNPTGVNPMPVLRYLPGQQFASYWLGMRLRGAQAGTATPRPDLAQQLAASRYRYGNVMNAQVHAGELTFTHQGQQGKVTVATEVYPTGAGSYMWSVIFLAGHFSRDGRQAEAAAAAAHAVATAQVQLQWLRRERHFAGIDHARAIEAMKATNETFRAAMAERSEIRASQARANGDLLSGTYRVVDPATNQHTTVQAGSNFYYRVRNTDVVIGANQEQSAVDLSPMLRLDWDVR